MNDKLKAAKAARRTLITGIVSGALIALYGLFISREHITEIGYAIGLNPLEAETLFVFIDFIAIYGKMLTSKRLTARTRRIGYKFLIFGGIASLACNVVAGFLHGKPGAAMYGAFIVGIVAALEYAIANTKAKVISLTPRTKAVEEAEEPKIAPSRSRKHPEGCTCGVHNRRKAGEVTNPVSPGAVPTEELNADMALAG